MNKPLDNWPALRTSSTEAAEHALCSIYGARHFEATNTREAFYAHANYKQLNALSLSYCSYTRPVTIKFPEAAFFRQAFSIVGAGMFSVGSREHSISAESGALVPPGVPLTAKFSEDFEQLLLRIDESALSRKLSALVEAPIDSKIEFLPLSQERTEFKALQRLVSYLANEISAPDTALAAPVLAELEQTILMAFLYANPGHFSKLLHRKPGSIAPWQVARAEEYIEANWISTLTIESLAEAIGASARSIFLSFQKARGYSPMAFARMTRLRHARRKLSAPELGTTVTGVALECGFQNMGHFAISYRKQFGESPSETLKRAKVGP